MARWAAAALLSAAMPAVTLCGCRAQKPEVEAPQPDPSNWPAGTVPAVLRAGPLAADQDAHRLLAEPLGAVHQLRPAPGEPAGARSTWRQVRPGPDGRLPAELPSGRDVGSRLYYFATYVRVPTRREAVLVAETDADVRAWLNGRTVLLEPSPVDTKSVHVESELSLPAGDSILLLAVGPGWTGLGLRLLSTDGRAMNDLRFATTPPDALNTVTAEPEDVGREWLQKGDPRYRRHPTAVFTAEVVETSRVPSAFSIQPYTECLMLVRYELMEAKLGDPPRRPLVLHWGMQDLEKTPAAELAPGDVVRLECDPFSTHEELHGYPVANDIPRSEREDWLMVLDWQRVEPPSAP
jgi:hypothetical protein